MNEIGHSEELQQNVYNRDSLHGNVVEYYFKPNQRMEINRPVELLTHYKKGYESKSVCVSIICAC